MRAKSHPAAHSRCSGHTVGPPVAAAYRHGPRSQGPGLKGEPEPRWLVSAILRIKGFWKAAGDLAKRQMEHRSFLDGIF